MGTDSLATLKYSLDPGAYPPTRAYPTDAGLDLRTPTRFMLRADSFKAVDMGIHVEIPEGYVGMIKSKSGLMCHDGITTDGTVDAGYTGSIRVCLFNHSHKHMEFRKGDKIAQLVILPVGLPEPVQADSIEGGDRGLNGFGSTGK